MHSASHKTQKCNASSEHNYNILDLSTLSHLVVFYRLFCERNHQTEIGHSLSELSYLLSGVVQGSAIGPLMFLIFINELTGIVEKYGIKVNVFVDNETVLVRSRRC